MKKKYIDIDDSDTNDINYDLIFKNYFFILKVLAPLK